MCSNKDVFIIMPFSSTNLSNGNNWTNVYELVFKPAIEECGYSCGRARPGMGNLIEGIVGALKNSFIVLADLTDKNPNVFYELGVRHSLSTRTILVTQREEDIPSDLRGLWFISYKTDLEGVDKFKKDIRKVLSEIKRQPNHIDNPVKDFLRKEKQELSYDHENIQEFNGRLLSLYKFKQGSKILCDFLLLDRFAGGPDRPLDIIFGVNQGGLSAAVFINNKLNRRLGIINTSRKSDGSIELSDVFIPSIGRQPEGILIADAKWKTGKSILTIHKTLLRKYPNTDIRYAVILGYEYRDKLLDSNRMSFEHPENDQIKIYAAYKTNVLAERNTTEIAYDSIEEEPRSIS